MSLLLLEQVAECLWAIEQELVRERQDKQNLEMRLENLMMVTEGLVEDLHGAASGNTRTASCHLAKPVKPSKYDGDCVNGCTFFNSCTLYLGLCVNEFRDNQAQILWTLSFMKMGRAATFTLLEFAHASKTGEVCFKDWKEFEEAFWYQFFPLHECTHTINQLESCQYHQGKCSVDE